MSFHAVAAFSDGAAHHRHMVRPLRDRLRALLDDFGPRYPDIAVRIYQSTRSVEEQRQAFLRGTTKIDGVRRLSYHNYTPSMAVDLWVYKRSHRDLPQFFESCDAGTAGAFEVGDRDMTLVIRGADGPKVLGMRTSSAYGLFGQLAPKHGLEWGGTWPNFFDGPHLQLPQRDRTLYVQERLNALGAQIAVDGHFGFQTEAALDRLAGADKSATAPGFPVTVAQLARLTEGDP